MEVPYQNKKFIQDTESADTVDLRAELVRLQAALDRMTFERDELLEQQRERERDAKPAEGEKASKPSESKHIKKTHSRRRRHHRKKKKDGKEDESDDEDDDTGDDSVERAADAAVAAGGGGDGNGGADGSAVAELQQKLSALEARYKAQQRNLLDSWERQRALKAELASKDGELDRLRLQMAAVEEERASTTATVPSNAASLAAAPAGEGGMRTMDRTPSERAKQLFNLEHTPGELYFIS